MQAFGSRCRGLQYLQPCQPASFTHPVINWTVHLRAATVIWYASTCDCTTFQKAHGELLCDTCFDCARAGYGYSGRVAQKCDQVGLWVAQVGWSARGTLMLTS
jgi:hypothetical protein